MKILGVLVGLVMAAAIGGHYVLWQQHSEALALGMEHAIANVNNKKGNEHIRFSYDSKSEGGYPLQATISYVNPVLTIDSEFYETSDFDEMPSTSFFTKLALDGEMVIRSQYLQNRTAAEFEGVLSAVGEEYEKPAEYTMSWDGASSCAVTLADSPISFITQEHQLDSADTFEDYLRAIATLDCESNNVNIHDVIAKKDVATWDKQSIKLTSAPSTLPDNHVVGMDFVMKDAEFFTDQSAMIEEFRMMYEPLTDKQRSYYELAIKHPLPLLDNTHSGKQDIIFKGSYDGVLEEDELEEYDFSTKLNIEQFTVNNALYSITLPANIKYQSDSGKTVLDVSHKGSIEYKPLYDELAAKTVDAIMAIIHSPDLKVNDDMRAQLAEIDRDTVSALIPPMVELGAFKTFASFRGSEVDGSVIIENAGFENNSYGVSIKGEGNTYQNKADATIICRNCADMLRGMMGYANHLQQVVSVLDVPMSGIAIDENVQDAIIALLQKYDVDTQPETLTLTVKGDGTGNMLLSGQPFIMVMMDALQVFGSVIQEFSEQ